MSAPMSRPVTSFADACFLRTTVGERPWCVGDGDPPTPIACSPIACSPDGGLAAGSLGRIVWVADTSTGEVLRWLETGSYHVSAMWFSRDGARLYLSGDCVFGLWDPRTGERPFTLAGWCRLPFASSSPDESRVVVDSLDHLRLIDLRTGAITTLRGGVVGLDARPTERVPPTFSADGRKVLTSDMALRCWDLASGACRELSSDGPFTHCCLAPDGTAIVARGGGHLHRYDLSTGALVASGTTNGSVQGLFLQRGTLWVRCDARDATGGSRLSPFDAGSLRSIEGDETTVPANTLLAVCDELRCFVHAAALQVTRHPREPVAETAPRSPCQELRFDADATFLTGRFGTQIAAGTASRWRLATGELSSALDRLSAGLRLAPDGASVVSLHHTASLTSPEPTLSDPPPKGPTDLVSAYAPGRNGRAVAICLETIFCDSLGVKSKLKPRHGLGYLPVWDEANELVISHNYRRIMAFYLRADAYLEPLSVARIRSFCSLGDGVWALTDTNLQLWDLRAREKRRTIKLPLPENDLALHLAVSPDGERAAIGTITGFVLLMELRGAERSLVFEASRAGKITACAFSDDGALLATGSAEPAVRVWDVNAALATAPAAKKNKKV